ncbi:MAG: bile acid:sodium symporter family protein [Mariprofundaceae bacterium]
MWLIHLCQAASRHLAPFTLLLAGAAWLWPAPFLPLAHGFMWLFAATMLALGLGLDPGEARDAARHPGRIAAGVLCQYSIMPLLGLLAATIVAASGGSNALALGFIVVGCAPGAMASNVITWLAGGMAAFSIAMTLVATLLSPLFTPMLVEALGGVLMAIPVWPMMQTILLTVVAPLLLGMALRPFIQRWRSEVDAIAPGFAALAIALICAYAVAANHARLGHMPLVALMLVIALNAGGYLLGWLAGGLIRLPRRWRITLAIEIGMQNAGLGVALALKHFPPEAAMPGAMFAVWCILTAAGLARGLRGTPPAAV